MAKNYKIYPNVKLGRNCNIAEYVIIGQPPPDIESGQLKTIIGSGALIRSHSVIYAGNVIGDNFQTGNHVMIREHNKIGNNVSIGTSSVVEHHVEIGDNVRIHSQAFICEYSNLQDGCWVGPRTTFTNVWHPLCPKAKECRKGPTVKKGAKIGANTTLLPGITVGENSLVGAGAVVIEDVPPNKVVVGNPARIIKGIKELTCPFNLIERPYRL